MSAQTDESECPAPTPTPSPAPAPNPTPEPTPTPAPACEPLPEGDAPPVLAEPEPCDTDCDCPTTPTGGGGSVTCLDALIADQAKEMAKAEHAKSFKAELEALLKAATTAKLAYPREVYIDLKTRWDTLDQAIVGVIDSVTCAVKCWKCLLECEACSLVYAIGDLQRKLHGDGTLMRDAHSLPDIEYWHQRNVAAKTAQFDRFKAALAAWNSPAATILAALNANEKAVQTIGTLSKAEQVLQLFLRIIPLHLAIAPRDVTSRIDARYRDICACDDGVPDDCCGPDAGVLPIRVQYLIGHQPYIVDPDDYFSIICCLVQHRYLPAKDQLAKASADLAEVSAQIKTLTAELEKRRKDILADALANIAQPLNCDRYPGGGNGCGGAQTPTPQQQTAK